ncbi:MAG: GHKL domain-containing protein [Magnetococcales bacterium]|nr:GHKL domain-containing protein [Magnetococcales bacterium]
MIRGSTIKNQLLGTLVIGLTVMILLSWFVVGFALRELTANYLEDRMDAEIASILAELSLDDADAISLDARHVDALFHFAFSGYYYQITLAGGDAPQLLRSRSLGNASLPTPPIRPGEKIRQRATGPNREPLLVLVKSITVRERQLTITVAENLTPIEGDLDEFLWIHGLISVLFLGLLVAIQIMAVRRAMGPIEAIREGVIRLETGQITRLDENVPEEMQPVVEQINHLLVRMEQRLVRSRSTIANLAHAMKSPLTTLTQILRATDASLSEERRGDMATRLDDLLSLIERELRRARLADYPVSGRFFNPEQALGMLARTLKNIHFQKKIDIDLDLPPGLSLPFDEEDMMEMLGNLLDNACKWCQGRVRVAVREEARQVTLRVEDDGPGVEPEEIVHLTRRGVRLDENRSGHGLGLAMVRETVEHYAGTIQFGRSEALGGFLAVIGLPIERNLFRKTQLSTPIKPLPGQHSGEGHP